MAHVDLAKAEFAEIGGQVARAAGLIGLAVAILILAALLVAIGTSLFLAEWLFGSMGWGILHGFLLFLSVAVAAILGAVGVSGRRLGRALFVALVIGIAVAVILGLDAPNLLYTRIGEAALPTVEPGIRPLVVGIAFGAIVGAIVGLIQAFRLRSGGSRVGAVVGLAIVGALLGAFTAITFGPQVGIALGIAAAYAAWTALMISDVARTGIDTEALRARFVPTRTIDTSKETLEWLQRRMPPGIGS